MIEEVSGSVEEASSPYHVRLDTFEGPLDLLLHLIQENKLDIYNIPIFEITKQYLHFLDLMRTLNLDVAGEFLVMAATLAHIKSQMLVPPDESQLDPEDEGVDPREALVRRLLEYQKYKDAALQLFSRPLLYRDVFKRERPDSLPGSAAPAELLEISVFKLVEVFHNLLRTVELSKPHGVEVETVRLAECVEMIREKVRDSKEGTLNFSELFDTQTTRRRIVMTFMALLEMLKRGAVQVFQSEPFAEIRVMGTPLLYGEWTYEEAEIDS
ncbi:MAG: segregation/condensation protein A [Pseudomonadota bacterium]